jgi:hypothetical protein
VGVNINIKRNFKVNNKVYHSLEEMPPDVREAFKKAVASGSGVHREISVQAQKTKITFNGREYGSLEAMPQEARQLYEKALKAAETGSVPADIISAGGKGDIPAGFGVDGPRREGTSINIEPALTARKLIFGLMLIALIILLYILFHAK